EENWEACHEYLEGIELFNAGYYWEAHEAWEPLWHVHGRRGPIADVLKGLIKLAAAGVKVREGRLAGARTHASRAAEALTRARSSAGPSQLGLDLDSLVQLAMQLSHDPPTDPAPRGAPVSKIFRFELHPVRSVS